MRVRLRKKSGQVSVVSPSPFESLPTRRLRGMAAKIYFTVRELECENEASASALPVFRSLITKVLFSPKVDHGPRGTSLKSTNLQSVTSVGCSPRKSRTAGETSRPAPLFRLGFGRSLPKTYCQWSVRNGPASSHWAYATRLPLRIATQRPLHVETAGP